MRKLKWIDKVWPQHVASHHSLMASLSHPPSFLSPKSFVRTWIVSGAAAAVKCPLCGPLSMSIMGGFYGYPGRKLVYVRSVFIWRLQNLISSSFCPSRALKYYVKISMLCPTYRASLTQPLLWMAVMYARPLAFFSSAWINKLNPM